MYAVIGGAGEVGMNLAKALYREGFNVAIIESDSASADQAEGLDVLIVRGNAASPTRLAEAGIDNADVFIAATGSDEVNMVSCALAKAKGCRTLARINSHDYIDEPVSEKLKAIGIDIAVCPDLVTAIRMSRVLTMPAFMDVEVFAGGKIQVIEAKVRKGSKVVGKALKDVSLPQRCNAVAIYRGSELIIPHGMDELYANDRVFLTIADPANMLPIESLFSGERPQEQARNSKSDIHKIMIVGATRIGVGLAQLLEKRSDVILLDPDPEACRLASEQLTSTLVINGSGTDEHVLVEEGIEGIDAMVAATHHEDTNVLACLLGKEYGARKTIALINRPELKPIFEHVGIDMAVSPRRATVSTILQKLFTSKRLAITLLQEGEARVMEFQVDSKSGVVGKQLGRIHFPEGAIVGAIVRGEDVIVPSGSDYVQAGDLLVVFAKTDVVPKVEKLLTHRGLFS